MKTSFLIRLSIAFSALFIFLKSSSQENYKILIDDQVLDIAAGKDYKVKINGKTVNLKLSPNDTLVYKDSSFSFKYPKGLTLSKVKVQKGLEQITLVNAEGSGYIVQWHYGISPVMMNELMLSETLKESITYGYESKRHDYKTTLSSGQEIEVNKAVLNYKGMTRIVEVASVGKTDEGLLIVTMIMDTDFGKEGKKMIELLWSSLNYH